MKKIAMITALMSLGFTGPTFAHGDEAHGENGAMAHHEDHAAALGNPGDAGKVNRTVEITMSDTMRFIPSNVKVKKGETIRFVLKNNGKIKHEMVLGSIKELKEHAAMMLKMPEMVHADANMASVEPGKTGELIWQFTKSGKFYFACLQPGHFEAGMKGKVVVAGAVSVRQNEAADDRGKMEMKAAMPDASAATDGEIKKIDKEAGKITIKHGPITNLKMPGMTMVFRVAEPAMLDQVKEGEKIKFHVEKMNGALTVTKIEEAK